MLPSGVDDFVMPAAVDGDGEVDIEWGLGRGGWGEPKGDALGLSDPTGGDGESRGTSESNSSSGDEAIAGGVVSGSRADVVGGSGYGGVESERQRREGTKRRRKDSKQRAADVCVGGERAKGLLESTHEVARTLYKRRRSIVMVEVVRWCRCGGAL